MKQLIKVADPERDRPRGSKLVQNTSRCRLIAVAVEASDCRDEHCWLILIELAWNMSPEVFAYLYAIKEMGNASTKKWN